MRRTSPQNSLHVIERRRPDTYDDLDAIAHGVGRLLGSVSGCRALCVYLRGDAQATWSTMPARGDTFHVDFCVLAPTSPHRGLRRSRDLAQQVVAQLQRMEESYLADRQ